MQIYFYFHDFCQRKHYSVPRVNWLAGLEPWVIWENQHVLHLRDSAVGCATEDCVFHGWATFSLV